MHHCWHADCRFLPARDPPLACRHGALAACIALMALFHGPFMPAQTSTSSGRVAALHPQPFQ